MDEKKQTDEQIDVETRNAKQVVEDVSGPKAALDSSDTSVSPEERKLVKKLDLRILPIACVMYFFAYLDRSNLGNARLQGLPQDALGGDPTGKLYGWVNSMFFFPYILLQVPATILMKLFPPRTWLGLAAIGWGTCSTLMSTGYNFAGLMVARFFLGVFEACFGPAIPLYMSYFYTKREMGLRMAYWFGFAAVAGAFGGLIAFGVQHVNASVANWRLLFIIEGIPSFLMGLVALIFLPNRPEMTNFFNEDEQKIAVERMNRSTSSDNGFTIKKAHILSALRDWRVYCGGVLYFGANCALSSISAFLPTIIETLGYTNAKAQLLTVPPYAVLAIVMVLASYTSDRIQSRGLLITSANLIGATGYAVLTGVTENQHARYFATFCITSGTYTTIGLVIAWYTHNLGSETKRATGIPLFMAIGHCGSVLGPHIYPSTEGPRYIKGFSLCCALEVLSAACALVLSISYRYANSRRNRSYGRPAGNAKVDTSDLADKAHDFRYIP